MISSVGIAVLLASAILVLHLISGRGCRGLAMRRSVWGVLLLLIVVALAVHPVAVTRVEAPSGVVVTTRPHGLFHGSISTQSSTDTTRKFVPATPAPPAPPAAYSTAPPPPPAAVKPVMSRKMRKPQPAEEPNPVVWHTTVESLRIGEKEAWDDALDGVRNRLMQELRLSTVPDPTFLQEHKWLVKKLEDKEPGPTVDGTETLKLRVTAELTAEGWRELARREQSHLAQHRLEVTARGLAVLTVLLGVIAGYIRLDEWTKGYYTGRLRLAAAVLAAAAGVVIAAA
jgi:hypothetical protein